MVEYRVGVCNKFNFYGKRVYVFIQSVEEKDGLYDYVVNSINIEFDFRFVVIVFQIQLSFFQIFRLYNMKSVIYVRQMVKKKYGGNEEKRKKGNMERKLKF